MKRGLTFEIEVMIILSIIGVIGSFVYSYIDDPERFGKCKSVSTVVQKNSTEKFHRKSNWNPSRS